VVIVSGPAPSGWPGPDGSHEVNFWRVREIKRLWREACEGCGARAWIPCPSGVAIFVPLIGQVTLGYPTVMTVQLRPGQLLADIAAVAPRIAHNMGLGGLRVTPFRGMWVRVELLAPTPPPRPAAAPPARPPMPPGRQPSPPWVPPTSRTGPSSAWLRRWHARRSHGDPASRPEP
jgi:hypothetical protein